MTTIAIRIDGRAITIEREIKRKSKEIIAKKIRSNNFTRSNREKSNITIAILENA